jgi:hypothetical protein
LGNRNGYYIQSGANIGGGNGSYQSPYLVSVAGDGLQNSRHVNNAMNIIRRSKNYLDELKN